MPRIYIKKKKKSSFIRTVVRKRELVESGGTYFFNSQINKYIYESRPQKIVIIVYFH